MNPRMRGLRSAVALGFAAAAVAATSAAAEARPDDAAGAAGAAAGAAKGATTLVFDKNPSDPSNSRLRLYKGGVLQAGYRAGSGMGVTNDCVRDKGWIPNGNWRVRLKSRTYNGQFVKGYAVYLQDMRCSTGKVTRTEMFIHSEMNRDGTQGRAEERRWNGPGDYRSNGCVKLKPADIRDLFSRLDRIGWPTHLRVVS
ncbi:L,D-transpeptidase family protein [Streptomyces thermolilacinus]|uniref:L,D-transpeptidase family protein n=1 Tax=Streptomyces thermolilacinus TaxID=285540 RepID=UPI0003F74C18|nr:L,D-transpeptidase [Streptomyces thermolilacinus]